MIRQFLSVFVLLVGVSANAFGQKAPKANWDGFPAYESVVDGVMKAYGNDQMAGVMTNFKLEKRVTGYVLKIETPETNYGPYLIWPQKASKPNFKDCTFLGEGNGSYFEYHRNTFLNQANEFGRNLYFGYEGYEDDVIASLEDRTKLNAAELQALAIAYSRKADAIMCTRFAAGRQHPFDVAWSLDVFKPSDFEEYDALIQKSIDAFDQMAKVDPYYPITIGYPVFKHGNQQVAAWLEYQMIGLKDRSNQWLKPNAYPPSMEDFAYNLLISCPPNAILFVNGDNDTYPVYWLQAFKHIREDVSVVNVSLINDRRYLRWVTSEMRGKMRTSVGIENPADQEMGKYYHYNDYPETENSIFTNIFHHAGAYASLIVEDSVLYLVPKPNPNWVAKADVESNSLEKIKLQGHNPGQEYWFLGDFVQIGIFVENLGKRPICFSHTVDKAFFHGLSDYLSSTGFVDVLRPFRQVLNENDPYGIGRCDAVVSANLFLNQFKFEGIQKSKDPIVLDNSFFKLLRADFYRTILQLRDDKAIEQLDALLKRMEATYDFQKLEYQFFDYQLAEIAWQRKQTTLANALLDMILRNVETDVKLLEKGQLDQNKQIRLSVILAEASASFRLAAREKDAQKLEGYWKTYESRLN